MDKQNVIHPHSGILFILKKKEIVTCATVLNLSCPTLCNPMDCSPPGSSVLGILQARILDSVAIPSSRDLPDPGIKPGPPALQVKGLLKTVSPVADHHLRDGQIQPHFPLHTLALESELNQSSLWKVLYYFQSTL